MGQHREAHPHRRGVSRGLLWTIIALVVVVALVVAWIVLGRTLSDDGAAAARTCAEGPETVSVVADADVAPALTTTAGAYTATRPVVRDRCITVQVRPADPKTTLDGLTGDWDTEELGAFPAAWVPASSVWSAQVLAARSSVVDGQPQSLVTSPVVLAVSDRFAQAARGRLSWIELPSLQRSASSLSEYGLVGWGSLRMALPVNPGVDASVLVAVAVATEVGRSGANGLTVTDARSSQVVSTVRDLRRQAPPVSASPAGTLRTVAGGAESPIHAVAVTEQALYSATASRPDTGVRELVPTGATPLADHPVVQLRDPRVSASASAAIDEFFRFTRTPDQMRTLTAAGFRGTTPTPTPTSAVTFPVIETPMPAPEQGAVGAVSALVLGG